MLKRPQPSKIFALFTACTSHKVMLNRGVELLAEDPLLVQRGILINAGNPGTTDTRMAPGADKTVEEGKTDHDACKGLQSRSYTVPLKSWVPMKTNIPKIAF